MCYGWEIIWLISTFLGWFVFKRWHFLCLWTWTCNAQLAVLYWFQQVRISQKPFWSYYYLKNCKIQSQKLAMFLMEPLYKVFTRLWSRLFKNPKPSYLLILKMQRVVVAEGMQRNTRRKFLKISLKCEMP